MHSYYVHVAPLIADGASHLQRIQLGLYLTPYQRLCRRCGLSKSIAWHHSLDFLDSQCQTIIYSILIGLLSLWLGGLRFSKEIHPKEVKNIYLFLLLSA